MASVQVIKDVVSLPIAVAELVDAVSDGVSIGEVLSVVGVLKKVKPAVDAIKTGTLLDVYKTLSVAEQAELAKWGEEEFDLKNDQLEKAIEQGWVVVLGLGELVKLVKP